ncbi:hypothetical protein [Brachybacterium sp. HMSC06H03]|uniref:hypothetical protein n=1 Tax=Brachybacterium sp. HMSC06H03 TaxID=1581127 RepID=UPI001AF01A7C
MMSSTAMPCSVFSALYGESLKRSEFSISGIDRSKYPRLRSSSKISLKVSLYSLRWK